ncbi:MAG: ECF transporter S component [Eubacteriaceae bacterium]
MKNTNTKKIVKIAALGAISFVLYFILEFPLLPGAPFLKFDFSDVAALVGSFAMGPVAGVIIEFLKNILHLLLKANEGSPVGELANFIVGCALVLPAAIIYKKKKVRKTALIGMLVGIVSLTIFAALFNYFVFIPLYAPGLLQGGAVKYIIATIVPFNLIKGIIICVVTFILYKYISPLLHK